MDFVFMSLKCSTEEFISGFRFKDCFILSINDIIILLRRANSIDFRIFFLIHGHIFTIHIVMIHVSQIHHYYK